MIDFLAEPTGCGDETFPPEEISFEVLGRANGLSKAYALQPSSQYIPVLCLETLSTFSHLPASKVWIWSLFVS